jgi:hypothetical protein
MTDLLDLIWSGKLDEVEVEPEATPVEIVDNKKIITNIESNTNFVCGLSGNRRKAGVTWTIVTFDNTTDNITVPAAWSKKKVIEHFESEGYRAELIK